MDKFRTIYLLAALFSACKATITQGPSNVAVQQGTTAVFTCSVDALDADLMFLWQRENEQLYLYVNNQGNPIGDANKYRFEITGTEFKMEILDTTLLDGNRYSCSDLSGADGVKEADLVVMDLPLLEVPPALTAGDNVELRAFLQFGSYFYNELDPDFQVYIICFLGGVKIPDGVEDKPIDNVSPGESWFTFESVYNQTLRREHSGETFSCDGRAGSFSIVSHHVLDIQYQVQDISFAPEKTTYNVGEHINCSANGNPYPTFKWTAVQSPNMGEFQSETLQLTEDLVGNNTWACTAQNTLGGLPTVLETTHTFIVQMYSTPSPGGQTGGSDSTLAIALGVTIPLVLIIIAAVVALILITKKRKQNNSGQSGRSGSHPSNKPGLQTINEEDEKRKSNMAYDGGEEDDDEEEEYDEPEIITKPAYNNNPSEPPRVHSTPLREEALKADNAYPNQRPEDQYYPNDGHYPPHEEKEAPQVPYSVPYKPVVAARGQAGSRENLRGSRPELRSSQPDLVGHGAYTNPGADTEV